MTKNKLLIINIVLFIILITISVIEKYPTIIYNKIKSIEISEPSFKDNWNYDHELKLYQYYQKEGKVVMLGNSITYRANWNELLNRNDIINRGIGADITAGFLSRLDYVYNVNPKICFIMGGFNDLTKGIKPETISKNLMKVSKKLKDRNIKPILCSILYTAEDFPNFKELNRSIERSNELIKEMCRNNKIEHVDLNLTLCENHILKKEYSFDGIHITALGYKKWSEVILPIVEREIE